MYAKMGYGVTNKVTTMKADAGKLKGCVSADVDIRSSCCAADVDAIAAIDGKATGLDRKRALQTLLATPGALSALARTPPPPRYATAPRLPRSPARPRHVATLQAGRIANARSACPRY